jgi:uncharacterized protein
MPALPIDRRDFLRGSGLAALTLVAAACSSDSAESTSSTGVASASAATSVSESSVVSLADQTTPTVIEAPSSVAPSTAAPFPVEAKQFQSLYVPMRDGVRIAIDVWIPAEAASGNIPTVARQTRYQRARRAATTALTDNSNFVEATQWLANGFAFVAIDARGTGASFGTRKSELSEDEIKDYDEVLTWIGSQTWSNKRIGTYGVSYDGDTAEMVARYKNPYLKAVAPLFNDFDPYRQIVFPGGVNLAAFGGWTAFTRAMDGIEGAFEEGAAVLAPLFGGADAATIQAALQPAPVISAEGESLVQAAIREHQGNTYYAFADNENRDRPIWDTLAISTFRSEIEASGVPMFIQVGWPDAATTEGTLERFATFSNPQDVWIGPWRHSGNQTVDYARPAARFSYADLDSEAQLGRLVEFFQKYLRDGEQPVKGKQLHLATNGADGWIETSTWPLAGVEDQSLFLQFGGKLVTSAETPKPSVLPTLPSTTGSANRWLTNAGLAGEQDYSGWAKLADARTAFSTEPFEQDTHILGFPVVSVDVSTEDTDGVLFAYLEKITPTGEVLYITEGMLRLSRRGKSQPTARTDQRLDRSFNAAENMPMKPGESASVVFQMVPTSTLFEVGSRLQLSFATSDTGSFASYSSPDARVSVMASSSAPALVVPVLKKA